MADRRRNRSAAPTASSDGDVTLDADTAKALALFNQRLAQQADAERAQRRIDKATRAKDQAAARVRALENDPKATAAARAEAAEAYREALDELDRAKRGEEEPAAAPDGDDAPDGEGEA
jgi:hypothetical protein